MQKTVYGAECPECAAEVSIEADARVSEIVECVECRSELGVATGQNGGAGDRVHRAPDADPGARGRRGLGRVDHHPELARDA